MILVSVLVLSWQISSGLLGAGVPLAELGFLATYAASSSALSVAVQATGSQTSQDKTTKAPDQSATPGTSAAPATPTGTPRGKKLVLKDGSFQVIRTYEKHGDRVRYFSIERGEWEEIPDGLIDWEATKKAEAAAEKADAAAVEKAHIQTEAARMDPPMEVDASLSVAKGVFLPEGEGMFVLEGKTIKALQQAGSQVRTDKKTFLEQVLVPIPVVPSKRNVELPGARATARIMTATPEFYLREPPPDPDRVSSVERTGRQNESGPEVLLIRAKVKGNKRYLEAMRSLMGQAMGEDREEISMQRWEVASDVYRFTLSEPLPPGEYALAEILNDGLNLFVWDFGMDGSAAPAKQSGAPK